MTSIRIHAPQEQNATGTPVRLALEQGMLVPRLLSRSATSARVGLIAGGALLLGGDAAHIEVVVGAGCTLEIQEIGGTVAYDADGEPSSWQVDIILHQDARLVWHGLPFVIATGASVTRSTRLEMASGSRAALRETIVLGRIGESGGVVDLSTEARIDGAAVLVERLVLDGADPQPGVLGTQRILDSIILLGARAAAPLALQLDGMGSIARYLGHELHRSPLDAIAAEWNDACLAGRGDSDTHYSVDNQVVDA